jgi:hypothetical protein
MLGNLAVRSCPRSHYERCLNFSTPGNSGCASSSSTTILLAFLDQHSGSRLNASA